MMHDYRLPTSIIDTLWLRGGHEAIICINTEVNTLSFDKKVAIAILLAISREQPLITQTTATFGAYYVEPRAANN